MNEQNENKPPALPHRENITSAQFNCLLGAFIQTANFLTASRNDEDRQGGPLDGGVVSAVEATVITLCERIDALVKDTARWDLGAHRKMEDAVTDIYTQQARMLSAQADAYAEITSPHGRYKPKVLKMKEGSWLAFAGDPNNLDNAMVGVGNCPEQALDAFDALFKGKVPEHLKGWLDARAEALKNGTPEPEFFETKPTQTQNDKSKTVDESGTGNSEIPARKRRYRRVYRNSNAPDPKVGGTDASPE